MTRDALPLSLAVQQVYSWQHPALHGANQAYSLSCSLYKAETQELVQH